MEKIAGYRDAPILTPEQASSLARELGLHAPESAGTIQDVRRGHDLYQRGHVRLSHTSSDGQRWYDVLSQGIWLGTGDEVYSVSLGSDPICTCPQGRKLMRDLPDDGKPYPVPPCKHGVACMEFEARQRAKPHFFWVDPDPEDADWIRWCEERRLHY